MAQNITIAGATYADVPAIDIPTANGDTARFMDTSDADATAADILLGKTAYVNGAMVTGEYDGCDDCEERISALEAIVVSLQNQIDALEARVAALEGGGGGGSSVNYNTQTGDLEFTGSGVYVDEYGYLVVDNATVDENGILTFATGSTDGVVNGILTLSSASVDNEGFLDLNASVDNEGFLVI